MLRLSNDARHVFFTVQGYDDFRENAEFATDQKGIRFATMNEEEYITKVRENSMLSLPTDEELMSYLGKITDPDF